MTPPDRFVWHPDVHEHFGEALSIFLIASRDAGSSEEFHRQLRGCLTAASFNGYSVYVAYGEYDALLRLWASEPGRKRFLREVERRLSVESIVEFRADHIYYSYEGDVRKSFTTQALFPLENEMRQVAKAQRDGTWDPITVALWESLRDRGLVFEVPPRVRGHAKFYVFLKATPGRVATADQLQAAVCEAAKSGGATSLTFYAGAGFCDFIVKGIATSYDDVLRAIDPLREVARRFRLNPTTMVPADYPDAAEADLVESAVRPLDDLTDDLLKLFDDEAAVSSELRALKDDDLAALARLAQDNRTLLTDPSVGADVLGLFRHSILKDHRQVSRSLDFLTDIEGEVRTTLARTLARLWGDGWLAQLRNLAADEVGTDSQDSEPTSLRDAGPDDWTLRQLMMSLRVAARDHPDVAAEIDTALPPQWWRETHDVVELRNAKAHGKLLKSVSDLSSFSGDWGKQLVLIFRAAALYAALVRFNDNHLPTRPLGGA